MRILQVNAVYGTASTGRTVKELSDQLTFMGYDSFVAYSHGEKQPDAFKYHTMLESKLHAVLSRLTGLQGYFSPIATGKLIKHIKKIKPDIVHLRNLHTNNISLVPLLKFLASRDIPTVLSLHDCWFLTGKCTHYTATACDKWKTGCHHCPRIKMDNPSLFFDRTAKMHRDKKRYFNAIPRLAVVGVSKWTMEQAKQSFLSGAKIIDYVYNWVDKDVFHPIVSDVRTKHRIDYEKFVILLVSAGWNDHEKRAAAIWLAQSVNSDMQVVMVGRVDDSSVIPQNIICIPYIDDTTELAKLYSTADVYVHLSLEDTFGKVVAEAISCGTPAIVYNSTALPELIGAGCGYVCEPGDRDDLLDKIKLVQKQGKASYSEACTGFASENFDYHLNSKKTIEIYKRLISE